MMEDQDRLKVFNVVCLTAIVTFLHYVTSIQLMRFHVVYRDFYLLIVVIAGFWFGIRGSLATSLSITLLNIPFILRHWQGMSSVDLDRLTDLVLYNVIAIVVGILRDRERARRKDTSEREQLALAGKALTAFAHEMKTPLVAIGGFVRRAKKHMGETNPDREMLNIVIHETERLEQLIEDMLDVSRPMEIERSQVDPNQLIDECIHIASNSAKEKKIQLINNSKDTLSTFLLDPHKIKQVIINLIKNAIEASTEGKTVIINAYTKEKTLIIDVTDMGCGVSIDKREKIFTPFFSSKKYGTGLGLSIALNIVEAHQGNISVVDNPTGGATFRIAVPKIG